MAQSKKRSTTYNDLYDHLKEEILSWLPVECVCRFRSVSKQWNNLLSSHNFITNVWRKKPANMNPWLVLHPVNSDCLAYCFFTRTWKTTSSISIENANNDGENEILGSAAGLFLLRTAPLLFVCNPLTRTLLELPSIKCTTIDVAGIMAEEGESSDTYKVVVVGISSLLNAHLIEIYDSKDKAWRIAMQVPKENAITMGRGRIAMQVPEENAIRMGRGTEMVFCGGSMYCLMSIEDDWNVLGFNIREGTSFSTPLPEMANGEKTCPYLVACGSRLLLSRGIVKEGEELLQELIIWEFEKVKVESSSSSSSSGWKEIARMPPPLCEGVNRTIFDAEYPFMCCVGVGDCACFVSNGDPLVIEVVVYNVGEKTWSSLPSCHLDEETGPNVWEGSVMVFEPRPDMKVL